MFHRLAVVTVVLQILSSRPLLERLGNCNYSAEREPLSSRCSCGASRAKLGALFLRERPREGLACNAVQEVLRQWNRLAASS